MDSFLSGFRLSGTTDYQFYLILGCAAIAQIPSVRLSADMSLKEITNEIKKLDGSKGRLHQESKTENGVQVVYLRRATVKESIKNLFMGSAKRKEQREPAFNLIGDIAKEAGLESGHFLMNNIKMSLKSGTPLHNGLEAIQNYVQRNP